MADASITITMFDGSVDNPPVEHKFTATAASAHLEYGNLEKIKLMVEEQYVSGVPLHCLPSVRDPKLQKNQSMIFIVEYQDFMKMSLMEIQEIFWHRSILVRNWPEKMVKFDWDGLSVLGPLKKESSIQGEWTS
jgi:hypothetical protein